MFKPHDVRGKLGEQITESSFYNLGKASARIFSKQLTSGRDYRQGHVSLEATFTAGYISEGGKVDCILGNVPSPIVAHANNGLGVAFTASHNPSGYCGAKFFSKNMFVTEKQMRSLESEFFKIKPHADALDHAPLKVTENAHELIKAYTEDLPEFGDGIFDLAGGAACALKDLFKQRIFDEPDPDFKDHDAEPKDATLDVLKRETIEKNQLGYAFDGDADRVLAVDKGVVIEGHVLTCFLAQRMLKKNDYVVLSIDCPSEAFTWLQDAGFKTVYSPVGDVNMIETSLKAGAKLGAERSGHYTFPPSHPYPDGLRAAAVASAHAKPGELIELSMQFKNITLIEPVYCKADFTRLAQIANEAPGVLSINTIDGVKADFEDYFILIRQSNTEPKIRVNVESKNEELAGKGMALAKGWVESCRIA